ncbi:MAG: hypothetical protein PHP79_09675 [Clostridia bacterium]|nr:hypothetical protein [Clostridia bacterium]
MTWRLISILAYTVVHTSIGILDTAPAVKVAALSGICAPAACDLWKKGSLFALVVVGHFMLTVLRVVCQPLYRKNVSTVTRHS